MLKHDLNKNGKSLEQKSSDLLPERNLNPNEITSIGRTIVIKGEVRADEHLIIEGTVEGHIAVPNHGLAVGQQAVVGDEVIARTITIGGTAKGKLTAVETIEILDTGHVEGRIVAKKIAIDEGAYFHGVVDPKLADAVIAVQRHKLKQNTESL